MVLPQLSGAATAAPAGDDVARGRAIGAEMAAIVEVPPLARLLAIAGMAMAPTPAASPKNATDPFHHMRPQRVAVPEPPRRTPPPMVRPAPLHPIVSRARRASGTYVPGPPMLKPTEIDRVLETARTRAKQRSVHHGDAPPLQSPVRVAPGGVRGGGARGGAPVRATRTLSTMSGIGINPWWHYQTETVPGGGRVMVNVGTGNMVLQDDDMAVAHAGIALAFRRTYNSQSQHDVNGSDGSAPSMYGNGWTNTFDAHLSSSAANITTVWDIDGAHYDYTLADDGVTWTPPTGQHATLTWDHGCGYLWTKKTGTSYYFWQASNGPCGPSYGGYYAGKLYQIIGRNRNTYITFNYSWDIGTHTAGDKVAAISATTESGMTATLWFADVSGHRLLQEIGFPDGATYVTYLYDAAGNLLWVSRPPNNAAGTRPMVGYIYTTLGTGPVMAYLTSPRWNGSDGGYIALGYNGTDAHSATIGYLAHVANVNPSIADGTGTALQSGYSTAPYEFYDEYFTTGVSTPTFRDTDGHATNWVVDGLGRPMQTQKCTATSGGNCIGTWLVSNENWDANNDLVSEVDPRGNETDYVYDPMGNTVIVAQPAVSAQTPAGTVTMRPTQMIDYDANNNVTAYCDQRATHAASADWSGTVSGPIDAQCASRGASVPHAIFTYGLRAPSYEPAGQLVAITSPLGYVRRIGYDAAKQGGTDRGLPTDLQGDPVGQANGTTRQSAQTIYYDASGNIVCAKADANDPHTTTILTYDALNRVIGTGDPDDASLSSSACSKTPGLPGSTIVSRTTYFSDGSVATKQTPAQAAAGVATQFTYDLDGNVTTEVHHFTGGDGTTTKWYDGADRLVEVKQPADPNDFYHFAWMTRYLYDLSSGRNVIIAGQSYRAYGGLYKTQELLPTSTVTPQWSSAGSTGQDGAGWNDTAGEGSDALGRPTQLYRNTGSGLLPVTNNYDATPATLGLATSSCNALSECQYFDYDARGSIHQMTFSTVVSPTRTYAYDEVGRLASAASANGTVTDIYDADGRKATRAQTVGAQSAATISYGYYASGERRSVGISTSQQSFPGALGFSYRGDGTLQTLTSIGSSRFDFSYTGGRRPLSRTDSTGQSADTMAYDAAGRTSALTTPG